MKKRLLTFMFIFVLFVSMSAPSFANGVENDFYTVEELGEITLLENGAHAKFDSPDPRLRLAVTSTGESFLGGGKWTYGLSSINLWSRYVNKVRVHRTLVRNCNGTHSSGWTKPGVHAIASIPKCKKGNQAEAYYK